MPSFSRALHMALTVRDMRASAGWYQRVLGFEFVREFQVAPGDAGIPRILLLHQHSGFLLGLCNPAGAPGRGIAELAGIAANGCPGRPMGPSASQRHLDGAQRSQP